MKLNISNPATGCNKLIDIDDERKVRCFYDKRMSSEVFGDSLGDEFKGYIFRITGGNDKQGFPMKQGVLVQGRVRLLLSEGHSCFRARRSGERRRKSVRGCIVGSDLSVISLSIIKRGKADLPGLTDTVLPKTKGPKRAGKIRKMFNLRKEDDVTKYVIGHEVTPKKEGRKPYIKTPKIQRLVTPTVIRRRKVLIKKKIDRINRSKEQAADYAKLLAQRSKEEREKKQLVKKARASSKASKVSAPKSEKVPTTVKATTKPVKSAKPPKGPKTNKATKA